MAPPPDSAAPALAAERVPAASTGADPAGRIVLVHGFTQNAGCWGPLVTELAADHELVLVDAPGHGRSSAVLPASFAAGAALIGEVGGTATYLGYSMGGRYALRLAIDRPDLVERLVLVGASPGLADADDRAARQRADEALADRLEAIGLGAFLEEWLDQPLFATLDPSARALPARLANTVAGLAGSLRTAGTGAMEPLWERLSDLRMPVLLVSGGEDAKFTGIAEEMARAIGPHARRVVLGHAGHTAHLEQPEAFVAALRDWLADTGG